MKTAFTKTTGIFLAALLLLCCLAPAALAAPTKSQMDAHASFKMGGRMIKMGDTLYYLQDDGLYQMNAEGKSSQRILSLTEATQLSAHGGMLYYLQDGENGHAVFRFTPGEKAPSKVVETLQEGYLIGGDVLYYSAEGADCALASLHLKTGEKRTIKNDYTSMYGFTFNGFFGERLYVSGQDSDSAEGGVDDYYTNVYDYKADTLETQALFNGWDFSASGEYVYARRNKGLYRFSVKANTGKLWGATLVQAFTAEQYDDYFLSGKYLYFIKYSEDGASLHRRLISGGAPKQVFARQSYDKFIEYFPCGEYIWLFEDGVLQEKIAK